MDVDACVVIIRAIIIKFSVNVKREKERGKKSENMQLHYLFNGNGQTINKRNQLNRIGTQFSKHVRKTWLFFHWRSHSAKNGVEHTKIIRTCFCENQTINCINWTELRSVKWGGKRMSVLEATISSTTESLRKFGTFSITVFIVTVLNVRLRPFEVFT